MAEIEPVENTGCKQDVNRAMKSGHVRTSWICNDWTAGLTAVDSVAYEEKIMRPHENMSARNAQVHSNDVFSTNETPFLIFGPFFQTLCLLRRHRHHNFSAIVPAGPYKMVYSYETLTPPPAYICQYNFVHNFAGTLDTAFFKNLPLPCNSTFNFKFMLTLLRKFFKA